MNDVLVYLARTKSHELLGDYFNGCENATQNNNAIKLNQ
ncbi:hypothetical protein L931_09055 [Helicobacter pylori PZ5024]|uniref:Uncharacterized protein n=1 Tax=Helicobacter pylori PZ5024 TaxID=1337391 RepID=T2SYG6_HELPX|nr:hypothetical protein HPHPH10_1617 [Helicobacter pylori Hp H-10]EQD97350.1 hypothetical protein L931_09055 [Helicobacter pylori PZ5024]